MGRAKRKIYLDVENLRGDSRTNTELDIPGMLVFIKDHFGKGDMKCYLKCDSVAELSAIKQVLGESTEIAYLLKAGFKGSPDLDVQLAVDVVEDFYEHDVKEVVLGSGDADFVPLLNFLEKHDVDVQILSNKKSFALNLSKRASSINFLTKECFKKEKKC